MFKRRKEDTLKHFNDAINQVNCAKLQFTANNSETALMFLQSSIDTLFTLKNELGALNVVYDPISSANVCVQPESLYFNIEPGSFNFDQPSYVPFTYENSSPEETPNYYPLGAGHMLNFENYTAPTFSDHNATPAFSEASSETATPSPFALPIPRIDLFGSASNLASETILQGFVTRLCLDHTLETKGGKIM